jgi:hydrogenase maturation protein HypF
VQNSRIVYEIAGIVQGVGFRPFVYKLALKYDLKGFVQNSSFGVMIDIEGNSRNLKMFEDALKSDTPPLAKIDTLQKTKFPPLGRKQFEIKKSKTLESKTALISPDISICKECLADLYADEGSYSCYFALNCTNCGPRYSIIKDIPYDRANTSMSVFKMCKNCKQKYEDPKNRRYHAEPSSCKECGLELSLYDNLGKLIGTKDDALSLSVKYIQDGKIVAIKGVGGFHLVCDATNDEAVKTLRMRKNRPAKPFALMCRDIFEAEKIGKIGSLEKDILLSKSRPIVVVKKNEKAFLSDEVAPNIDRVGLFLPYTPLHYLLFEHLDTPIVATSANLCDEPIIKNSKVLLEKLSGAIDFYLDYNREIVNSCDDSVVQVVSKKMQMIRLSRGYAPKAIKLPFKIDKKILAVGANQKSSVVLAYEDTMIITPHIGDLNTICACEYFERTIDTFKRFYDFEPDIIVSDKHPNYEATKWAKKQGKTCFEVGHHYAHILSCMAEYGLREKVLGFSWDGTGYGDDGTIWGGEVFICDIKSYERKYHFKTFKLLGGQKAVKEPRRVGLGILFEYYSLEEILKMDLPTIKAFSQSEIKILYQAWKKDINTPRCSSVGRLFDAIASYAGILQYVSYEAESGMYIQKLYDFSIKEVFSYTIKDGEISLPWDEIICESEQSVMVSKFINTLCAIIVDISKKENLPVILSGGVFQNGVLLERVVDGFKKQKIDNFLQSQIPMNDGGIALGQMWWAVHQDLE